MVTSSIKDESSFHSFLFSLVLHGLVLVVIGYSRFQLNTSGASGNIEVNIVERSKSEPQAPIVQKSPYMPKYAEPGEGPSETKKGKEFDMTDYANKLKSVVDPVFVNKSRASGLQSLSATVLFFPKENGQITNIRVVKSSGNKMFDKLCIETLKDVGFIPPPPASLTSEGIQWDFGI